ncbi:hypothetical protein ACLK15_25520 [Escherichia coli]
MGKIAAIFVFNKRGAMPLTQEERIMTLFLICKRWRSAALLPLFLTRTPVRSTITEKVLLFGQAIHTAGK